MLPASIVVNQLQYVCREKEEHIWEMGQGTPLSLKGELEREREISEKKKSGSIESLWEWYIAILHHEKSIFFT